MQRFKFLIIAFLVICPSVYAEELTELQKLKAENFQLKLQVAQLKATLADREIRLVQVDLTLEQTKLIEEFRKQLKADEKDNFNWSCLCFNKPAK